MARLYREQQANFRTQYSEVKERVGSAGALLPGSPGTLVNKTVSGHTYAYRAYQALPGKQIETIVGKASETDKLQAMREQIAFSEWVSEQVRALRGLGFQVADKSTAAVLVELANRGALDAGLTLVGTLAYAAWLNEFGAIPPPASRTLDVDFARSNRIKLAAPISFLETMQATGLPFTPIPSLDPREPATSVKLPGLDGIRVDLLAPGPHLGKAVYVPELQWAAQQIPHYDFLLLAPERAAVLAGWHCIPVMVPRADRMVWHKLYSSTQRQDRGKAAKDFQQAMALAAVVAENEPTSLQGAYEDAPKTMIAPVRALLPRLVAGLEAHPAAAEILRKCLASKRRACSKPVSIRGQE